MRLFRKNIASIFWRFRVRKLVFWKTKRTFLWFRNVSIVLFLPNSERVRWNDFEKEFKHWISKCYWGWVTQCLFLSTKDFVWQILFLFFKNELRSKNEHRKERRRDFSSTPWAPITQIFQKVLFTDFTSFERNHQMGTFN